MSAALYDPRIEDLARRAAFLGGEISLKAFANRRRVPATVVEKLGHFDVVTETDRDVEEAIIALIMGEAPNSRILGEERGWTGSGPLTWMIDPIDGTSNFASGLPIFATSVAAFREGIPIGAAIYEPARDDIFHLVNGELNIGEEPFRWEDHRLRTQDVELLSNAPYEGRGISDADLSRSRNVLKRFRAVRRLGACTLHIAYVAAGQAAACFEYDFSPWDVAAGLQLAEASGCTIAAWTTDQEQIAEPVRRPEEIARLLVTAPGLDVGSIDWVGE